MSGRMTLGSLFVLAILMPELCHAQGGYGYGPGGPPNAAVVPGQMGPQSYQMQPGYGSGNTVYEQLPDDPGFLYDQSPVDNFMTGLFRHAYFRGEYLLWNATGAKSSLLGGTPPGGFIPSTVATPLPDNTFAVTANPTTGNPATAVEPSLSGFNLQYLNGFRGTIGVPIGRGTFEASSFIFGTRDNIFDGTKLITQEVPPNLLATPPVTTDIPGNFIGQPITIGGVSQTLLYTNSYTALMNTSIWGAEANYILDAPNAGTGDIFTFSPLIGVRYFNYRETLSQSGSYQYVTDPTTTPVTTAAANRSIYSQTNNHIYGLQVGLRTEATISKVVFGAEPKIMLGVNTYDNGMSAVNVPFDTPSSNTPLNFQKTATGFSPIADLRLYSRINISQYMNVYVGYDLMWVGSITRPGDNIGYNLTSTGAGLFNTVFSDTTLTGLSVGGEIRY